MDLWFGTHPYATQKAETAGGVMYITVGQREGGGAPSSAVVSSHPSVKAPFIKTSLL